MWSYSILLLLAIASFGNCSLESITNYLTKHKASPNRSEWHIFRRYCSSRRHQSACSQIFRYFRNVAIPNDFQEDPIHPIGWSSSAMGGVGKRERSSVTKHEYRPEQYGDDTGVLGSNFLIVSDGVSSDPASDYFSWQLVKFMLAGLPRIADSTRPADELYRLASLFQKIIARLYLCGSATLSIAMLSGDDLIVACLGDSEVKVIRDGRVIYRSVRQRDGDRPGQIGARHRGVRDMRIDQVHVRRGDVIIAATDGLWDNFFEKDMVKVAKKYSTKMRKLTVALIRRALFNSSLHRQECTYEAHHRHRQCVGGVLDDISILTAIV
jgi:serine/threonine protein phosphatase PrpC